MECNLNENRQAGWIKLYRSIKKHWIWEDPIKLKWWLDILIEVNHTGRNVNLGYSLIECKRGESIKSLGTWATEWKVSKDTVRNFFTLLKKDKMILTESVGVSTRLTVCNYDAYTLDLHDEPTSKQTASKRDTYTNKNANNGIIKEVINVPFELFWNLYNHKKNKHKSELLWNKLTDPERAEVMRTLPQWLKQFTDKQYQPHPTTYLNSKRWTDEIATINTPLTKVGKDLAA